MQVSHSSEVEVRVEGFTGLPRHRRSWGVRAPPAAAFLPGLLQKLLLEVGKLTCCSSSSWAKADSEKTMAHETMNDPFGKTWSILSEAVEILQDPQKHAHESL